MAAITEQRFDDLVKLPHSHSPCQPVKFQIDSRSAADISLSWNYDLFTSVEPCKLKTSTPVGSMPLEMNAVGVVWILHRILCRSFRTKASSWHGIPKCVRSRQFYEHFSHLSHQQVWHVLAHPTLSCGAHYAGPDNLD